jgi:hypothetical protein
MLSSFDVFCLSIVHARGLTDGQTFTRWANNFLMERMMKIEDLASDLSDGLHLINLLEVISSKHLPNYNKKPKIRAQMLENTGACLQFLKNEGIKLVAIGPEGTWFSSSSGSGYRTDVPALQISPTRTSSSSSV